jgi:hypothetical protein
MSSQVPNQIDFDRVGSLHRSNNSVGRRNKVSPGAIILRDLLFFDIVRPKGGTAIFAFLPGNSMKLKMQSWGEIPSYFARPDQDWWNLSQSIWDALVRRSMIDVINHKLEGCQQKVFDILIFRRDSSKNYVDSSFPRNMVTSIDCARNVRIVRYSLMEVIERCHRHKLTYYYYLYTNLSSFSCTLLK